MKTESLSNFELLIGKAALENFAKKTITIVGLGGVGQPILLNLANSGFKNFILIEPDTVHASNLNRQFMFDEADVGKSKLSAIRTFFKNEKLNFLLCIEAFDPKKELKTDLIIDATDNNETRLMINDYAVKRNIPHLFISATAWIGQCALFKPHSGCLKCVFPNLDGDECGGVSIAATQGIASIATREAIKYFTDVKFETDFVILDLNETELRKIKVKTDPNCSCSKV